MNSPRPLLQRSMQQAAELRASGYSWPMVARKLRRKFHTVVKWPGAYPETWRTLLEAARREIAEQAADEAVAVLRTQLRGPEEKITQAAARELLNHQPPAEPPPPAECSNVLHRFVDHLEGLTDEELDTLLGEVSVRHPGGAANGAADPPAAELSA